jgi:PHD/YefM family antitoxin component YafN of YafNO toxin-antitoxin module
MYIMRTYATAEAREHLSEILTKAERGESVVIERRGVRFRVEMVREVTKPAPRRKSA